jgi:hypothetical protein
MSTILYFNEELHKYTNEAGLTYTSMTTVIGKYEDKFDADKMAKQCHQRYFRKKGHRYFNMTVKEIKQSWVKLNTDACDRGNERHNYLEDIVKDSSGYHRNSSRFINDRIYTIDDILVDHNFGRIDLEYFATKGLDKRYPSIYAVIEDLVNKGWRIYSEIGVYYNPLMVSGLIDILFVKGDKFRILDWKTNKAKLHFESGYFKRNELGRDTDHWVADGKTFKAPLRHIQASHGNTYTLQLSGYAWLIEQFGLKCNGLLLCHIRPKELDEFGNIPADAKTDDDIIDFVMIKYLKEDVEMMFKHHYRVYAEKQTNLNL